MPAGPGRPSLYTQEIADEIINRLSLGEPLAQICRSEGIPAVRTIGDWKLVNTDFNARFVRAREDGFDALAAQCLDIADETDHDNIVTEDGERPNTEWISRSKLRVETRLRLLAKWDPKRYGDKLQTEHTGADGGPLQMLLGQLGKTSIPVVSDPDD